MIAERDWYRSQSLTPRRETMPPTKRSGQCALRYRGCVAQHKAFDDICAQMTPAERQEFLIGIGLCIGSSVEATRTRSMVRRATKQLIADGFHVEAASVLVSNGMRKDALAAVKVGLAYHSSTEIEDLAVRVRLVELESAAERLPS